MINENGLNDAALLPTQSDIQSAEHEADTLSASLFHKSWQIRIEAYNQLLILLNTHGAEQCAYTLPENWIHYLSEVNPKVYECVIEAFLSFSKKEFPITHDELAAIISALVEKVSFFNKDSIKEKSFDSISQIYAYNHDAINSIISSFSTKNYKLQLTAAQCANYLIEQYEAELVSADGIISAFQILSNSPSKIVRDEVITFFKLAQGILGDSILPSINQLKPSIRDQVIESIELNENISVKATIGTPPSKSLLDYTKQKCDTFYLIKEWRSKKEWMDKLKLAMISSKEKQIPEHLYLFIEGSLKKEINIIVIESILEVITELAKERIYDHWKQATILLLSMLKHKKLEANIMKVLIYLNKSIRISEIIEPIRDLLDCTNKVVNPSIKKGVLQWIGNYVQSTESIISDADISILNKIVSKLTGDASSEIRLAASFTLSSLSEKVSANMQSSPNSQISQSTQNTQPIYNTITNISISQKYAKNSKMPNANNSIISICKKMEMGEQFNNCSFNTNMFSHEDQQDTETFVIYDQIDEKITKLLLSSALPEKKAGFAELHALTKDANTISTLQNASMQIVHLLRESLSQWKEQNSDLVNSCMAVLFEISKVIEMQEDSAQILMPFLADKYCIPKYRKEADEIVMQICDSLGPSYIAIKLMNYLGKSTAYKDISILICKLISEYPSQLLPIEDLLESSIKLLNTNCKAAAHDIIKKLYMYNIDIIKPTINDRQLRWVGNELEGIQPVKEPRCLRTLRGDAAKLMNITDNKAEKLTKLIDISQSLAPLLKCITSDSWSIRNETINQLRQAALKAGSRMSPCNLTELFKLISTRFKDTHKGVQKGYINLLGVFIDALNSSIKQYYKILLPPLIEVFSDKQQNIRAEAYEILSKFRNATEGDYIIDLLAPCLLKDSPALRAEVLKWLSREKIGYKSCDHKLLIPGIMQCLQDKLKEVRNMAEIVLKEICPYVTREQLLKAIQDEKPIAKLFLTDEINKFSPQKIEDFSARCREPYRSPRYRVSSPDAVKKAEKSVPNKRDTCYNSAKDLIIPNNLSPIRKHLSTSISKSVKKSRINLQVSSYTKRNTSSQLFSARNADEHNNTTYKSPSPYPKCIRIERPKSNVYYLASRYDKLMLANKLQSSPSASSFTKGEFKSHGNESSQIYSPVMLTPLKDKDKRNEFDSKHPWPMNEVREEYLSMLKKILKTSINPSLYEAMFTTKEFKKHIDCIYSFKHSLTKEYDEIITMLDLLLKWISLRVLDGNPGLTKVIFDFLIELSSKLMENKYQMNETEISILLQLTIDKLGGNNSYLRELSRKLILMTVKIANNGVVITLLVRGLRSKLSKTKLELIGIIQQIIELQSSITFVSDKDFYTISQLIISKDTTIKMAIAELLTTASKIDQNTFESKMSGITNEGVLKEIKYKINIKALRRISMDSQEAPIEEIPKPTKSNNEISASLLAIITTPTSQSRQHKSEFHNITSDITSNQKYEDTSNLFTSLVSIEDAQGTSALINALMESKASNILPLTKAVCKAVSDEYSINGIEQLLQCYSSNDYIYTIKDVDALESLLSSVIRRIKEFDTNSSLSMSLVTILYRADPTVIASVLIELSYKYLGIEALLTNYATVAFKRIKDINISEVMKRLVASSDGLVNAISELFIKACVNEIGTQMWKYIPLCFGKLKLISYIDSQIMAYHPELAAIIKDMKTVGVKGLGVKLKAYGETHKDFNFDIAFSRYSELLMNEIKEEMNGGSKMVLSPKGGFRNILMKLKDSNASMGKADGDVSSRLKELSDEVTMLKQKGIL